MNIFSIFFSVFQVLFGIFLVIMFWYFLLNTDYLNEWYPKIGAGVASHGALFGAVYFFIKKMNNI
jgi:hypothetical protein